MSGYLVSASGLSSRISERFVEGQMSDMPGLSGAYLSRLSVCSDCFSDKHPFDVAPSHIRPSNVQRDTSTNGLVTGLFLGLFFFTEWCKFLAQRKRRCRKDVRQPRVAVKIGVLLTYRGSRRPTQRDSVTTALLIGARWCRAILFRRVASSHGSVRGLSKDTCRTSQG